MAVGEPLLGLDSAPNGAGKSDRKGKLLKVLALVSVGMACVALYSYATSDQSAVNMIDVSRPLPQAGEVYDLLPELYDSKLDRPAQADLLHQLYDSSLDSPAVEWQAQGDGKTLGGKCGFCIG
jgi:hypothetical protein